MPSSRVRLSSGSRQSARTRTPARRHLLFAPRPLHGQAFYLDVHGKSRDSLEGAIIRLGGSTEKFLGKHVTAVITDKPTAVRRTSPRLKNKPGMSRAQAMVLKARANPATGSTDVINTARAWDLKVISAEDFLKWAESNTSRAGTGKRQASHRVRKLRGAFIKVEDQSRNYRPLFKEMKSWPRLNFDAPPGYGPFDDVTAPKTRAKSSSSEPRQARKCVTRSPRQRAEQARKATRSTGKAGYCEVCDVTYKGVTRHLASKKHRQQAMKSDKYSRVDKLIRSGRTLQEFVQSVRARQHDRRTRSPSKTTSQSVSQTPSSSSRLTRNLGHRHLPSSEHTPTRTVTPLKLRRLQGGYYTVADKRRRSAGRDVTPSKRHHAEHEYDSVLLSPLRIMIRRSARLCEHTGHALEGSAYFTVPAVVGRTSLHEDKIRASTARDIA
ncbi:protein DBF4 homolog B [Nematostella vectensis]|nr:protein DBF4 homolog B [Nematostella vectensis]